MATFTKFDQFVLDLGRGVHNFASHTLKVAYSNTAPNTATAAVLADITQITAQNGYVAGGPTVASPTWSKSGGTSSLAAADVTINASGGPFGPWRYHILYNDTPSSPAKPVIGFWDRGNSITTNDGEPATTDFGATILQLG